MSIIDAWHRIFSNWRKLLLIELLSICIGIVVILSIPKEYTSKVVLAPETKASTSSYGLINSIFDGALLSEFNGSGYGSSKDAIYPMIYPLFFESPTYTKSFFNISFPLNNETNITLQEYIDRKLKYPWWSIFSNQTKDSKTAGRDSVNKCNSTFYMNDKEWDTIKKIQDRITLIVDKKTFVMTIGVTMQDPYIAAVVADSVCNIIKGTINSYRKNKAIQNLEYIQTLYDDAEREYEKAQLAYREFQDTHRGKYLYKERAYCDKLKVDVELKTSTFNQLTRQLQIAKSKVAEDRPVFAILEPPIVTLKPSYPHTVLCLSGFVLIGFIISLCIIFK